MPMRIPSSLHNCPYRRIHLANHETNDSVDRRHDTPDTLALNPGTKARIDAPPGESAVWNPREATQVRDVQNVCATHSDFARFGIEIGGTSS
jgi:hypothetical protein